MFNSVWGKIGSILIMNLWTKFIVFSFLFSLIYLLAGEKNWIQFYRITLQIVHGIHHTQHSAHNILIYSTTICACIFYRNRNIQFKKCTEMKLFCIYRHKTLYNFSKFFWAYTIVWSIWKDQSCNGFYSAIFVSVCEYVIVLNSLRWFFEWMCLHDIARSAMQKYTIYMHIVNMVKMAHFTFSFVCICRAYQCTFIFETEVYKWWASVVKLFNPGGDQQLLLSGK